MLHHLRADTTAAFNQRKDGDFVPHEVTTMPARFPANVSFISFNRAGEFVIKYWVLQ